MRKFNRDAFIRFGYLIDQFVKRRNNAEIIRLVREKFTDPFIDRNNLFFGVECNDAVLHRRDDSLELFLFVIGFVYLFVDAVDHRDATVDQLFDFVIAFIIKFKRRVGCYRRALHVADELTDRF
ncbi:hypothetical protein SDC9_193415 [bioreactor metagenome]|uniref:Uncharacterized protein n=1 Tax=bioreactor metagenome TaxID=1076179 RepID=A0A645I3Z5_9ZZZZ